MPCGRAGVPPRVYSHVVVVVLENHSYGQIAGSSPYLNGLARMCGLAANYEAVSHPSLPNYLALTSGSTDGISSDCTGCSTSARSIFEQLSGEWRSYEESMPTVGYRGAASGEYAKKHNPAAYYTRIAGAYARDDLPVGSLSSGPLIDDLRRSTLRRLSLIVPNLCNDEHDCPVEAGDAWLREWMPRILASRAYNRGTAVFITYDEGSLLDNRVYTVVVSPSTPAGTVVRTSFSHYSLLKTVQSLLGLPCLAHACDRAAASMRAAFRL